MREGYPSISDEIVDPIERDEDGFIANTCARWAGRER